jgi:hypothetical protein
MRDVLARVRLRRQQRVWRTGAMKEFSLADLTTSLPDQQHNPTWTREVGAHLLDLDSP